MTANTAGYDDAPKLRVDISGSIVGRKRSHSEMCDVSFPLPPIIHGQSSRLPRSNESYEEDVLYRMPTDYRSDPPLATKDIMELVKEKLTSRETNLPFVPLPESTETFGLDLTFLSGFKLDQKRYLYWYYLNQVLLIMTDSKNRVGKHTDRLLWILAAIHQARVRHVDDGIKNKLGSSSDEARFLREETTKQIREVQSFLRRRWKCRKSEEDIAKAFAELCRLNEQNTIKTIEGALKDWDDSNKHTQRLDQRVLPVVDSTKVSHKGVDDAILSRTIRGALDRAMYDNIREFKTTSDTQDLDEERKDRILAHIMLNPVAFTKLLSGNINGFSEVSNEDEDNVVVRTENKEQ